MVRGIGPKLEVVHKMKVSELYVNEEDLYITKVKHVISSQGEFLMGCNRTGLWSSIKCDYNKFSQAKDKIQLYKDLLF